MANMIPMPCPRCGKGPVYYMRRVEVGYSVRAYIDEEGDPYYSESELKAEWSDTQTEWLYCEHCHADIEDHPIERRR